METRTYIISVADHTKHALHCTISGVGKFTVVDSFFCNSQSARIAQNNSIGATIYAKHTIEFIVAISNGINHCFANSVMKHAAVLSYAPFKPSLGGNGKEQFAHHQRNKIIEIAFPTSIVCQPVVPLQITSRQNIYQIQIIRPKGRKGLANGKSFSEHQ